jgi:hypothetical protein
MDIDQDGIYMGYHDDTWNIQCIMIYMKSGFQMRKHVLSESLARRASFQYRKNDTVLSGIGTDRPARLRAAAAAARCAGREPRRRGSSGIVTGCMYQVHTGMY